MVAKLPKVAKFFSAKEQASEICFNEESDDNTSSENEDQMNETIEMDRSLASQIVSQQVPEIQSLTISSPMDTDKSNFLVENLTSNQKILIIQYGPCQPSGPFPQTFNK